MNLCRACGQDFRSLKAFDAHQVGRCEYTFAEGMCMEPPREDGFRCLDVDELEELAFVRNAFGRWSLAGDLERGRQMLLEVPESADGVAPERLRGEG